MIVAIGGWVDAQEAATSAVRYLIRRLAATKFAELDPEDFYVFGRIRPYVVMDEEGRRSIRWPTNDAYYWRWEDADRDAVFFVGTEPFIHWKTYANCILEAARACNAQSVTFLGAFLDGTPHTRTPGVFGSASTPALQEVLAEASIPGARRRPQYQGPTGISTAVMLAFDEQHIPYASLMGRAPHYLQTSPNPKVSLALLEHLLRFMPFPVDLKPLREAAEGFEAEVNKAISGNLELTTYIRRLETQYDEGKSEEEVPPQQSQEELPSSDVVVRDLEEFLRKQQGGDTKPQS